MRSTATITLARVAKLWLRTAALALVLVFVFPAFARADPIISTQSLTVPDGGSGFFDVFLTVPNGESITGLASFSLGISVPAASGIHFQNIQSSEAVGQPYVFGGTSFFFFSPTVFPDTNALASDSTTVLAGIDLTGPMTTGLARVFFTVDPGTATGSSLIIPVTLDAGTTLLSDPLGTQIPATLAPGTIAVTTAGTVVPEPATLAVFVLGLGGLAVPVCWRGRFRAWLDRGR